jgi:glucose/arabinose dehydrogenase
VLALGASGCGDSGAPTPRGLHLERIGRFEEPLFLAQPRGGDGTIYVVERAGRVRAVEPGGDVAAKPFLDVRDRVRAKAEGGLLSLAFAPDYTRSSRLYVAYSGRDGRFHVDEYRGSASLGEIDPARRSEVLAIAHPNDIHWGGQLAFGPGGHLYVATGDGGPDYPIPVTSQQRDGLLGKILRIDPAARPGGPYRVPSDNPYVGRPGADEVYALGLRNPWRFSIDATTGDLWIGDVGDFTQEEIDRVAAQDAAGANFGWPDLEGTAQTKSDVKAPNSIRPVVTYRRSGKPNDPNCAVTGGYVVRDRDLPSLYGRYLYGDFCKGQIRSLRLRGAGAREHRPTGFTAAREDRPTGLNVPRLVSFAEDADGRIYAISLDGPVYRLAEGGE